MDKETEMPGLVRLGENLIPVETLDFLTKRLTHALRSAGISLVVEVPHIGWFYLHGWHEIESYAEDGDAFLAKRMGVDKQEWIEWRSFMVDWAAGGRCHGMNRKQVPCQNRLRYRALHDFVKADRKGRYCCFRHDKPLAVTNPFAITNEANGDDKAKDDVEA